MDNNIILTAIQIYANACSNGKKPIIALDDFIEVFKKAFLKNDIQTIRNLIIQLNSVNKKV